MTPSSFLRRAAYFLLMSGGLALSLASSAYADTLVFDFTGSGSSGSWGNQRTYTVGGVTITATAWGYTRGSSNDAFENAALGRWSTGLGVCNRDEGSGCSSPDHQVDNQGPDDYVLFLFSSTIDPTIVRIDPWGNYDRDVSYWVGNVDISTINLSNKQYLDLAGMGFGARQDDDGTSSDSFRDVSIGGGTANALLFGAKYGSSDDFFKITSMTIETPSVHTPEPSAILLLGTGLGILILRRNRKSEDK